MFGSTPSLFPSSVPAQASLQRLVIALYFGFWFGTHWIHLLLLIRTEYRWSTGTWASSHDSPSPVAISAANRSSARGGTPWTPESVLRFWSAWSGAGLCVQFQPFWAYVSNCLVWQILFCCRHQFPLFLTMGWSVGLGMGALIKLFYSEHSIVSYSLYSEWLLVSINHHLLRN